MAGVKYTYGRMVDVVDSFTPSEESLDILAESMAHDRRNRIHAGYTYLGQFIDHDITRERDAQNKTVPPWYTIRLGTVENRRTPFLNLETIYGDDLPFNQGEPSRKMLLQHRSYTLLKLGDTVPGTNVNQSFAGKDLPRKPGRPFADIVDDRNDENLAVAQTQLLFMRFHNEVVRRVFGGQDTAATFESARKIVIQHYQWVILYDYLPKILKGPVLADILANGNRFYFPDPVSPYIPLEYSVAAFRAGHATISDTYNWNRFFNDDPATDKLGPAGLEDLMRFTGKGGMDGHNGLVSDWVINWNWFYNVSNVRQNQKLNFAKPFSTKLPRMTSPTAVYNRHGSLAAQDLFRSSAHGLPSGQAVAEAILGGRSRVLKPEQIANVLPPKLKSLFSEHTPLWFYLLAEAEIEEHGCNLGEVGSRIMAEVFVELIKLSEYSILVERFQPVREWCDSKGRFDMARILRFVANGRKEELDPLGI